MRVSRQNPRETRQDATGLYSPLGPRLWNPAGLRRFRAKLGDYAESRVEITGIGHSIMFGKGSANNNVETDVQAKDASWMGRLRKSFVLETGIDAGEGWLKMDDSRYTNSGSGSAASTTMVSKGRGLQNGQSLSFALPAGTDIDVMIWKDTATGVVAVPTYNVDGGSDVTPTVAAGNDYWPVIPISTGANTTHTLVLKGPATGTAYISGVRSRSATPLGVGVNRLGVAGMILTDTSGAANNSTAKDRVRRATVVGTKADLLIIECDTNDSSAGTAVATWKAEAQAWIDVAVANGACVLIVGDPRQNTLSTSVEDGFAAASRELALANTHCAYIRIADWWGSYTQGVDLGLYNASNVHPSRRGHGEIAQVIFNALTGRLNAGIVSAV